MIVCTPIVERDLNLIYSDYSIAYVGKRFSNAFKRWNFDFCSDVTYAIKTLSRRYTGKTCNLVMEFVQTDKLGKIAIILRCDFNMSLLRDVESETNDERIQAGLPSVRPSTFTHTPSVNFTKSPKLTWKMPKKKGLTLPPKTRILKGSYYNGLKVAYYNHKYTILNADGNPIIDKWFDKRPRFFTKPFGKYNIIAHVSYNKGLYALGVDGKIYSMDKMFSDAYMNESYIILFRQLISEVIRRYIKKGILLESKNGQIIRINEQGLHRIVHEVLARLVA